MTSLPTLTHLERESDHSNFVAFRKQPVLFSYQNFFFLQPLFFYMYDITRPIREKTVPLYILRKCDIENLYKLSLAKLRSSVKFLESPVLLCMLRKCDLRIYISYH
jgi:hypothetical protein